MSGYGEPVGTGNQWVRGTSGYGDQRTMGMGNREFSVGVSVRKLVKSSVFGIVTLVLLDIVIRT